MLLKITRCFIQNHLKLFKISVVGMTVVVRGVVVLGRAVLVVLRFFVVLGFLVGFPKQDVSQHISFKVR